MNVTPAIMAEVGLRLGLGDYGLLVVADGSGGRLDRPCGWCCFAHDPSCRRVWTHLGGANGGTNNYAELAPFVHALWHYHQTHFPPFSPRRGPVDFRVEFVSDSELTVRCGNGRYARNASGALWASIDWFSSTGYRLHWNHVPRNSNPANADADRRGREVRLLLEGLPGGRPTQQSPDKE